MIKSVWDSMFLEDIMANVFGAGIAAGAILLYFSRSTTTRIFPRAFNHPPFFSFWGKWNNRKDQETAAAEVGPAGTGKHFCISKGGQLHHIFVGKKLVGTV